MAFFGACAFPGGPSPDGQDDDFVPPALVSSSLTCDLDAERWTIEAETDAWTGGGTFAWSSDLESIEQHGVPSISAAEDGSADQLRLVLPIVSDWREASPGSSTAMRCGQDPSWALVVFDRFGEPADCATGGPDPTGLLALEGLPDCP